PPPDLTNVHDFTVPADLTGGDLSGVDLLSCAPQCNANGWQCGGDTCGGTCGTCPSHTFCDTGQTCSPCGHIGEGCCPPSSLMLPPMGCDPGLECDTNTQCNPPPDLMPPPPDMTVCGTVGFPCCNGTTCSTGM